MRVSSFKSPRNTRVVCPECEGSGELENENGDLYQCPECKGLGYVKLKRRENEN